MAGLFTKYANRPVNPAHFCVGSNNLWTACIALLLHSLVQHANSDMLPNHWGIMLHVHSIYSDVLNVAPLSFVCAYTIVSVCIEVCAHTQLSWNPICLSGCSVSTNLNW